MSLRTGACLLALACWLIAGGAVHAASDGKDRPSHIPLPPLPGAPEVSPEAFQEQLNQLALDDFLRQVVNHPEKYLKQEDVEAAKALQAKTGRAPILDPNDPRVQDLVKKLLKEYEGKQPETLSPGTTKISPELLEALKEKGKQFQTQTQMPAGAGTGAANPGNGDTQPQDNPQPTEQGKPNSSENSGATMSMKPLPPPDPSGLGTPAPKTEEEKKDEERNKAFMKALEAFKESKSLSKAVEALKSGQENDLTAPRPWDGKSGFDWDKFGKTTGLDRAATHLPKIDWHWPEAAKLPSVSAPSWDMSNPPSLPSAPSGLRAGGPIIAIILTALLVIVLGLVAWMLRRGFSRGGAADATWRLGPWPVQPALVRTREELIRAFEYLSLLRFGRAARAWNHRHIATQLGSMQDPPCAAAAVRLALVYEHARYAPKADPLADTDIEAARRDLTFLAGVTGA